MTNIYELAGAVTIVVLTFSGLGVFIWLAVEGFKLTRAKLEAGAQLIDTRTIEKLGTRLT